MTDVRDLRVQDLPALEWSGGPLHLEAVARSVERARRGEVDYLAVWESNEIVAIGGLDTTKVSGFGVLWQLAVHPRRQSQGFGTILIAALEGRAAGRDLTDVRLEVEVENPRAQSLYQRLGYRVTGHTVESWDELDSEGGRVRKHADCLVMTKSLSD